MNADDQLIDLEPERYELFTNAAYNFRLDRRDFIKTFGVGIVFVVCASDTLTQESGRGGFNNNLPKNIDAWIHLGENGSVTVLTGKVEVGQNARTSLTQAVADELRLPISSIQIIMGDTDLVPFDAGTFGSRTTPTMAPQLRKAAAAAREALIVIAAEKLKVSPGDLDLVCERCSSPTVKEGSTTEFISKDKSKRLSLAEVAKSQKLVKIIPDNIAINPPATWTVAGTSVLKTNARDFVTGQHRYVSDLKREGMLYGKIVRPPAFNSKLITVDQKKASTLAGVKVIVDGDFIGVVAPDQETFMPRKGAPARGRQMAMLSGMAHERFTSREMGEAIRGAADENLNAGAQVNLREIKRTHDRAVRLPVELVREMAETSAAAKMAWREAREKDRFPLFAPFLAKQVELKKRYADAVGFETEPYDALLDDYEQGMTAAELSRVFGDLRERLVPLAARIRAAKAPRADFLRRPYPREAQERLCLQLLALFGYDFDAGRMDVAPHPFTISFGPGDVRITTRFDDQFFNTAFFGTAHEAGHALYDQGLLPEHEGTPLGDSVSLGIHESQSRLWENVVARSRPFWSHFFPMVRQHFPDALADVSAEEFYRAVNLAQPSLIRVEADEVYYNLHIMLRFEIERDLFRGAIRAEETATAWRDRMQEYVGIRPSNDREGVLQDIHWSMGLMGYFPTYALGNLYAAQFIDAARRVLPDLDGLMASGDLRPVLGWLRKQIHEPGMTWRSGELVQRVTGKPLDSSYFLAYLEAKYADIYGI